jgi:hypothetical protein
MFCPQCSQQQASNEIRFCPRCGFPLSGVSQLLASGGNLPGVGDSTVKPKSSPRKQGYKQAFVLIMLCFVLAPLTGVINHFDTIPAVFFMAGLARLIYARWFQDGDPKLDQNLSRNAFVSPAASSQMNNANQSMYLPPGQSVPVNNFVPRRIDTAEIVERPSVTEHTTKLLETEPKS